MTAFLDLGTARSRAESLMTSTCRINEKGDGGNVTDPETGEVTTPAGALVYEGRCRVRPRDVQSSDGESGGAELVRFDYQVAIPFAEVGVQEGHRVTVTLSPDPALVGVVVEVRMVARGDTITARRLLCEEVS